MDEEHRFEPGLLRAPITREATVRAPGGSRPRPRRAGPLVAGFGCLALAACTVTPDPLSEAELRAKADADLAAAYARQEALERPLTLHEAMARAVLYNLDRRVRVKEEALAQAQLDVSRYDMLPSVVASAGYVGRSNTSASSSRSVDTGLESLETSTSLEKDRFVADLTFAWNVPDFGVSYFTAEQQANRALIASERRRRVVQEIVADVRVAYWRALAAKHLMARVDPVMARVRQALERAGEEERRRVRAPLEALTYQRELLKTLRELEDLRTHLSVARTELAALINLPLDREFRLASPDDAMRTVSLPERGPDELGRIALVNHPGLIEQHYDGRIAKAEITKAMLRFLPGIELSSGVNYDSNRFLLHNNWIDYSAKVTWNLLSLLTGPANLERAEAEADVASARRQALGVAVLSQTYLAYATLEEAKGQYERAVEMADLDRRIRRQLRDRYRAGQVGELAVIQAEVDALVAELREDLALVRQQNALGQLFVAIGGDPLPETLPSVDLATLTGAIAERERAWRAGEVAGLVDGPSTGKPERPAPPSGS